MPWESRDDLLKFIAERYNNDNSDEMLEALENASGFLDSFGTDSQEWEKKYRENDAQWRARYAERFFGGPISENNGTTVEKVTTETIKPSEELSEEEEIEREVKIEDIFAPEE